MTRTRHQNQLGFSIIEIVIAMAVALVLMTFVGQLLSKKMNAIKNLKETGELRDLRALLKRKINCPVTLATANCNAVSNTLAKGIACGGADLIDLPQGTSHTKFGSNELRVRCGTDFGLNRILVEYRNSSSKNQWRDINRGIPWTCDAAAPSGIALTSTKFSGSYACSIGNDGAVYCWGKNFLGVLGDPTVDVALPSPVTASWSTFRTCPAMVQGLVAPVSEIKLGFSTACAKDAVGLKCWGAIQGDMPFKKYFPNYMDYMGVSIYSFLAEIQRSAVSVFGSSFATLPQQFSLEDLSSCAIVGGRVWCWGNHASGPGLNTIVPQPVGNIDGTTRIATYVQGTAAKGCAIVNGGVMCWVVEWTSPPNPPSASYIAGLGPSAGVTQLRGSCVLVNGLVKCWGTDYNQNAIAGLFDLPNLTGPVSKIQGGSASHLFDCALQGGAVKCFGGYLGEHHLSPTFATMKVVPGLASGVTDLSCDGRCCAEVTNQGQICFGPGGGQALSFPSVYSPPSALTFQGCPGFHAGSPQSSPPPATCGS